MKITIVNCFDTYEDRVDMLCKALRADGHTVFVVCSDWRHYQKCVRTDSKEGFILVHAKPYQKNISAARILSHKAFAKAALQAAADTDPDILWVLVPPNYLIKEAALLKKKRPSIKLVLDFNDLWPETMPIAKMKGTLPFRVWKNLREKYVNEADLIVTECGLFRDALIQETEDPQKLHILYPGRDLPEIKTDNKPPTDQIALCYLGSINNIIDINKIAEIIKAFASPVILHIIGGGEKEAELVKAAENAGATVVCHGNIYEPLEKQKIFDSCHFGLNVLKDSVFIGLTMKSIDYFAGGLPIINTLHGDTECFVEERKLGINYKSIDDFGRFSLDNAQKCRQEIRPFYEKHFSENTFSSTLHDIMNRLTKEAQKTL